ncbi:hypothetical protein [Deinococcus soli (ex Cha et al. 2016)]|uniref:Uncharacterized protein n=2 Tax=Deinococcus soli (ex Cha et al. 2016) TaxID=1309411 RepID=A0ACC6KQC2_9DEIO|nr:hypothetical protein [Deinococcus soli (ex Cha et al. 2016)]MDR6221457.1 hypothetical protein [Deinococcus soli (ex Cha et al. 2016)]MDR6331447.1 hypothetical protein [Deinococcus soli (ex Cha et al. 2016)]MDR6754602.1 hypothetical protein [Deinococcus soli (ex Cha et al. 2016)]
MKTQLLALQQAGLVQVLFAQLSEALHHSEADIQQSLLSLGVEANDGGVLLRDLSFEQHIGRDAYTQVGSHNQQFNVQGPLVQVPGGSAEQLHTLFPQPGDKARAVLRQECQAFVAFLKVLPQLPLAERSAASEWYETVEAHCMPLAQALVVAVKRVPPEVVSGELQGLLVEAIKVLRLQISVHVDYSLGWRVYPLLILATAVLVAVLDSQRWSVLPALVNPTIPLHGGQQIRWLYLTSYADGLQEYGLYPVATRYARGSMAVEERVTQLLIGEQGWLKEDLPLFGNERLMVQAHAVLAFLNFDSVRRYFSKRQQEHIRVGYYLSNKVAATEAISAFVRGVNTLSEPSEVLISGGHLLYSDFITLMSQ